MRFYNKYRNGIYTESKVCMPVIAKYGNGTGNTPLVKTYVTSHQDYHMRAVEDQAPALISTDHKDPPVLAIIPEEEKNAIVRRLTPTECLRLQGFPDDWLSIGDWVDSKGKKHKESDSVKYRAIGNSIALPFWGWLAERIAERTGPGATMASLFDGISGFPLVFSRAGIRPVWSSEIEEYCIAVAKTHFPEDEDDYCSFAERREDAEQLQNDH